jgi:dTDP-4-dehydrorhamnose 3,5-epimerase-like enzyme/dTDP-4-dehydrorhamnose reductase
MHSLSALPFAPAEILVAFNVRHTLKGLHRSPYAKVVFVSRGRIHDFYVTERGEHVERALGAGDWMCIPAGVAHGYYCEEDSQVLYMLEAPFDPALDSVFYWRSPELCFAHAFLGPAAPADAARPDIPLIISPKDAMAGYLRPYDVLVLGATGFLGRHAVVALEEVGTSVLCVDTRLADHAKLAEHIRRSGARHVLCAAGISGRPTVQWCETHELETYEANMLDMCNLMRMCKAARVHLTILGSGLVHQAKGCDDGGPGGSGPGGGFTEDDPPDLVSLTYCRYRVMLETVVRRLYSDDVLYLRIIYPCTFDGDPKCFFQKMLGRRDSVHNANVPITVVPDLFPRLLPGLVTGTITGVLNFVNRGTVGLPDMLRDGLRIQGGGAVAASGDATRFELCTAKLQSLFDRPLPDAASAVVRHLRRMQRMHAQGNDADAAAAADAATAPATATAAAPATAASAYGYILPRYVRTAEHAHIWVECLRCIRLHDPHRPVLIIDDHSDPDFMPADVDARVMAEDPLTTIVRSRYDRGRAELLPFLYLHSDRPFEKAVVLNDSMFLQNSIADMVEAVTDVAFLWDFGPRQHDRDAMLHIIGHLDNAHELLALADNAQMWTGCFASGAVITWDFLDRLERSYGMPSRLAPLVSNREGRFQLERVFALCCIHARGWARGAPQALCGCIFSHPLAFCMSFEFYAQVMNQEIEYNGRVIAFDPEVVKMVKVWNSR